MSGNFISNFLGTGAGELSAKDARGRTSTPATVMSVASAVTTSLVQIKELKLGTLSHLPRAPQVIRGRARIRPHALRTQGTALSITPNCLQIAILSSEAPICPSSLMKYYRVATEMSENEPIYFQNLDGISQQMYTKGAKVRVRENQKPHRRDIRDGPQEWG